LAAPGCRTAKINMREIIFGTRNYLAAVDRDSQHIRPSEASVIILGIILVVVGVIAKISILTTIGVILVVIGAILFLLGSTGRAVGGRSHYF